MSSRVTFNVDVEAADIRTLSMMPIEEYRTYLREEVFYVDHHDVFRSFLAGYPIAANKDQLEALIEYLREIRPKVKDPL